MVLKRTGAGIAVLRGRDLLLMQRRDNGLWDLPGGDAETSESPEQAARRELHEETGLEVGAVQPLGVFMNRHTYADGNVVAWETHVFTADFEGGEAQPGDDAQAARWWPLDALPERVSQATRQYFSALQEARA